MDLIATKIIVAILFGALRFLFGCLPIKLYHFLKHWEHEQEDSTHFINEKRHNQLNCGIALCQSFGGGVLFATCFLHMMPEVFRSVEDLKILGGFVSNYPLSQLTICFGFFLVYFVEEVSNWIITRIPDTPSAICQPKTARPSSKISILDQSKMGNAFIIDSEAKNIDDVEEELDENETDLESTEIIEFDKLSISSEVVKENEKNNAISQELSESVEPVEALKEKQLEKQKEKVLEKEVKTKQQVLRGMLVILALSFHALFEGLAIGLQNSSANIWYLFIAVSIHSATILFCMGVELILARTKLVIIYVNITVLALTSPFGILLGLMITLETDLNTKAKSTAIVLLEGLSAGTILYITFFEVLNREKHRRVWRIRRAFCILGGFALMALLQCAESGK